MPRSIFERVRAIIANELRVQPGQITLDTNLRGSRLQADSLDLVNLVLAFATEFQVEMKDEEVQDIVTVGDLVHYLEAGSALHPAR